MTNPNFDTHRPYARLRRQPAKGCSMADHQMIVFDSRVDVSEETDLAFDYFESFSDDYDLHRLMQGMLVAISYLAEDEGHPVQ